MCQSSHKMYSNNILIFFSVYDNFKSPYKKNVRRLNLGIIHYKVVIKLLIKIFSNTYQTIFNSARMKWNFFLLTY